MSKTIKQADTLQGLTTSLLRDVRNNHGMHMESAKDHALVHVLTGSMEDHANALTEHAAHLALSPVLRSLEDLSNKAVSLHRSIVSQAAAPMIERADAPEEESQPCQPVAIPIEEDDQ